MSRNGFDAVMFAMRKEEAQIQAVIARSVRAGTVGKFSPNYGRQYMTLTEIADYMDAAADYLQKNGWVRGSRGVEGNPRCALGAIDSTVPPANREVVRKAFSYALAAQNEMNQLASIPIWNDHSAADKLEVIASFRACAIYIREVLWKEAQSLSFEEIWAGAVPKLQDAADNLLQQMGDSVLHDKLSIIEEDLIMAKGGPR